MCNCFLERLHSRQWRHQLGSQEENTTIRPYLAEKSSIRIDISNNLNESTNMTFRHALTQMFEVDPQMWETRFHPNLALCNLEGTKKKCWQNYRYRIKVAKNSNLSNWWQGLTKEAMVVPFKGMPRASDVRISIAWSLLMQTTNP